MKIYWSIQKLPELAQLSQRQRREAWRHCYQTYALKQWPVHLSLFGFSGLVTLSLQVGILATAIAAMVGAIIYQQTVMHSLRPHLRHYVETQWP